MLRVARACEPVAMGVHLGLRVARRAAAVIVAVGVAVVVAGVLGLGACTGEAAHGLEAREAGEAVAALALAGVTATHRATADRGEVIEVPAGEEAYAAGVLRAEGVPRAVHAGFAALAAGAGLVPSPAEDDARWLAALGGEIARHLAHLDGVADASVVTTRPRVDPLAPAETPHPTASVLIVVKAAARPSWTEADVQRLVAAAAGGRPEDVTVVLAHAPPPRAAQPLLATVGPITVARSSRPLVIAIFAAAALVLLALGILLIVLERRRAAERIRRERAEAEATAMAVPKG